ncbi:LPXTG cell wall anchor domain-containing protein [Enterococcus sp. LJL51]|uniref:LPXTG cell wall anchor domain-containing protein n=1 Tax=Enterococcus sp. LJL51 TaxID=3416656 RepID=UPI003CF4308B
MKRFKLFSSLFISVVVMAFIFMGRPAISLAAENGGAVQTNGVVSFYEETTEPSSSTEPSTTTEPTTTPTKPSGSKPAGKYPSTGELVKKSLGISGAALVLIALILFYVKRRKEQASGEGKGS